jgi:aspartate/methionine/tyrosine aminotransferase
MPDFRPFELEHYQSLYEHTVGVNLADSSVRCLDVGSWLAPEDREALLASGLGYPQVNGLQRLRERIAGLYPSTSPEEVLVTVGAAQANHLAATTLLEEGDEVVVFSPGYRQLPGIAWNLGCRVKEVRMDPDRDWAVDWDAFDALVTEKTRMVAVVNPNNPNGRILAPEERDRVVAACARVGAWLHADEVYQGTELDGHEVPTFRGGYDRLVVTNSFSKAYGLAGLRIGWAVSDPETIQDLWRRHEYQVIAAAGPSMLLAETALAPERRRALLDRQRTLSRAGHAVLAGWLAENRDFFSVAPTPATSMGFVRFHLDVPSLEVAERIRKEASILVAPGSHLGTEGHLRITVGYEEERVRPALDRIAEVVRGMA